MLLVATWWMTCWDLTLEAVIKWLYISENEIIVQVFKKKIIICEQRPCIHRLAQAAAVVSVEFSNVSAESEWSLWSNRLPAWVVLFVMHF